MQAHLSNRDELRQIADEIEVKIHLASLEARDRWAHLEQRLVALERRIASSGERVDERTKPELTAIADDLRALRDDLFDGL